jgi:hypothetical protein
MRFSLKIVIVFFFLFNTAVPQNLSDSVHSNDGWTTAKKIISVAGVSGIYIGTLADSYLIWWKDDKRPFSVLHRPWVETRYDNGIDKLGHFYTSYVFYKVQKNIFLWGGFTPETARILSGALTFGMALIIEVGDGYSRYGFDYKDLAFNAGGLTYAWLQDDFPFLRNINFKWSYFPSEGFVFPPKFSEHYEGHIYWLTFNLHGLFDSDQSWLQYFQPAIGYSINKNSYGEYVVGLDLNLLPLFQSDNPLVGYIGEFVNLFHIPFPGIKYSERKKPEYKILLLN